MAYEYFKGMTNRLLAKIIKRECYKGYVEKKGITLESVNGKNLYRMARNRVDFLLSDIVNPILNIYGLNIILDTNNMTCCNYALFSKYYMRMIDRHKKIIGQNVMIFNFCQDYMGLEHLSMDIDDKEIIFNSFALLLRDPLSFFLNNKLEKSRIFVQKVIDNNVAYWIELHWAIRLVCDMYLNLDICWIIRGMIMSVRKWVIYV